MICLAGSIVIAAAANTSALAADDCLSGPKGNTPVGKHWYYRIDRPTRKHCWYLGDEGARSNKTASSKPAATVAMAAAQNEQPSPPLESSVANARAELPPSSAAAWAPSQITQPEEPAPDATPPEEGTRRLTTRDLITQAPITLASRWPLSNEFQPTQSQTQPQDQTQAEPQAEPALPETAQNPLPSKQFMAEQTANTRIGPLQIFLCVLAIALALGAILGRVIFQHTAAAHRKHATRARRRPLWPDQMPQSGVRPSYAQMIIPERRPRPIRAEHEVADEIEQLLRGVTRRHG